MSRATETTEQETTTTTAWMRLARGAAITMVIWAILLHLTARTVIPPVIVVGLIFLGFVPFLVGERRRLGLAFAIVAAIAMLGNAPVIADELTHPESAPSFVLTLLSVLAVLVAVAAGLGAFRGWSVSGIRPLALGGVAVFIVGALTSIGLFVATENAVALEGDAIVLAEKVEFGPADIAIAAGGAGVFIDNKDGIYHTFTIEEIGVDLNIPALKAARVDIDASPGTYEIQCTVPGHENMKGTLTVNS